MDSIVEHEANEDFMMIETSSGKHTVQDTLDYRPISQRKIK